MYPRLDSAQTNKNLFINFTTQFRTVATRRDKITFHVLSDAHIAIFLEQLCCNASLAARFYGILIKLFVLHG